MKHRKIPITRQLLFTLIILIVFFLLTESAPRLITTRPPGLPDVSLVAPRSDPPPDPPTEYIYFDLPGGQIQLKQGTRDDSVFHTGPGPQVFSQKKPADTLRIAFLGGSTTFGYLSSKSFSEFVKEMLAKEGRQVEILNAGKIGMPSNGVLGMLPEVLSVFRPDLIVVECAHNEILDVRQHYLVQRPHLPIVKKTLDFMQNLYIFSFLKNLYLEQILTKYQQKFAYQADPFTPFTKTHIHSRVVKLIQERLRRNLSLMNDICRLHRVKFMMVNGVYCAGRVESTRAWGMFCYPAEADCLRVAEAEKIFDKIWGHLTSEETEAASQELQRITETRHGLYWAYLGRVEEQRGHVQEASRAYNRSLDLAWRPVANAMNPTIATLASEKNIPLADVYGRLARLSGRSSLAPSFFTDLVWDFMHPNAMGHREIAVEIVETIRQNNLLPKPQYSLAN